MIHYLKREELDTKKYDACINLSINSRIYACSWYLDCVADNWDVLVLNDYEAVMPLPWRSKYFIKYIYPPAWTQQLGVFSKNQIPESLILEFIKSIPKKFKKITIQFNSGNKFQHKNITERVNYLLPLDKTYKELYNNYRKDRRKRIRQFEKQGLQILNNISFEEVKKEFYFNYNNKLNIRVIKLHVLESLLNNSRTCNFVHCKSIHLKGGLLSALIYLKYGNRITILFSVTTELGLKLNAFSGIINKLIEENENSFNVIDFEGSMIKSIASFNSSFGAYQEKYYTFQKKFRLL